MRRNPPRILIRVAVVALCWLAFAGPALAAPHATTTPKGSVPMYRGNPARTGENPGPGPVGTPVLRWKVRLGLGISSSPAVAGGIVFVGSVDPYSQEGGALHAVDAETGEEFWRLTTNPGDGIFSSPAVVDGTVYAGSYDGVVVAAIAASGEKLWRFQAETAVFSSPAVVDGVVYLGDDAGYLYALDAKTGELRWRFGVDEPYERRMGAAPAVVAGTVYVISLARRVGEQWFLHVIDATTGEERWRFAAESGGHLRGSPVVVDGEVYVATYEGVVYALNAADGAIRWRFDSGATNQTQLASAGDLLYVAADDGVLRAIDRSTGEVRWAQGPTGGTPFASAPTVATGTIYVGDARGFLYALDAATGEERWRFMAKSYMSSPAIVDGLVYVGGDDGILRAIGGVDPGASFP